MNRKLLGLVLLFPVFLMGTSVLVRKSATPAPRPEPPKKVVVERAVRPQALTTRKSAPVETVTTTTAAAAHVYDHSDDIRHRPLLRPED